MLLDHCYLILGGGPLLSTLHSVAMVTIDANNDPFGVFSIAPVLVETTESGGACKLIELTITRTGKRCGQVNGRSLERG